MKCRYIAVLWGVCLLCAVFAEAVNEADLRCRCINTHSARIHPKYIKNVSLYPSSPACANVEVIAVLKTGKEICLNPTSNWVKRIIKRILENCMNVEHKRSIATLEGGALQARVKWSSMKSVVTVHAVVKDGRPQTVVQKSLTVHVY
nr:PREDICTED: interleukin-8-like [Latimeria chalumnae]|eukprot:XP_014353481.1 PREDICTED: interleukin-8-like [Latimeria chalumnae]